MAGKDNLKPFTKANAREMGRKGGKISSKKKAELRHMGETLHSLLILNMSAPDDLKEMIPADMKKNLSVMDVLLLEQIRKGVFEADTRATAFIRDTMAENPQHNESVADNLNSAFDPLAGLLEGGNSLYNKFHGEEGEPTEEEEEAENVRVWESAADAVLRYLVLYRPEIFKESFDWIRQEAKTPEGVLSGSVSDFMADNGGFELIQEYAQERGLPPIPTEDGEEDPGED